MKKPWRVPAAALAGGLVALVVLLGCGREQSVAGKSAAAFEEALKRGETFGGDGHAHGGHEAAPSGGEPAEEVPQQSAEEEEHHAGHGAAEDPHAGHGATGVESPVDHSGMGHGTGARGAGHAGHGSPVAQPPASHAGHPPSSASAGEAPSRTVAALPEQPAGILRPDQIDAPAPTSVLDAQRSAEMNQAMSGGAAGHGSGHGGHGTGTYRHVDAGRGAGSEPQASGAGSQHHDHGAAGEETAVYVCPMHPEVTSKTPGTCPKCGMALVERREE